MSFHKSVFLFKVTQALKKEFDDENRKRNRRSLF